MTLDEALLYDAEWWLSKDLPRLHKSEIMVIDVRMEWSEGKINDDDVEFETDSWLNLFIREAIRDV